MKSRKGFVAVLAALCVLAIAPPAVAQQGPERFSIAPTEVVPGGTTRGYGYSVLGCTGREVVSPGFVAPLKFSSDGSNRYFGTATAIMTPGAYPMTFYCVDGSAHALGMFTILDAPPVTTTPPPTTTTPKPPAKPKPPVVKPRGAADTGGGANAQPVPKIELDQVEYDPGSAIVVYSSAMNRCLGTVTSPGFTAPVTLNGKDPRWYPASGAVAQAVQTPGTYTATGCGGTATFRIKGTPPTTPKPPAKPKPPVVKPRGAADTGGGGTA